MEQIKLGGFTHEEIKKINDNFNEVATDYAKKTEIPEAVTVPTNVSAFTNDAGYQTAAQVAAAVGAIDVPTKTSELTNDSNYATTTQVNSAVAGVNVPTKLSELTNDAGYVKTTDTAFLNKVDAEAGKQLSSNDYTAEDKNKVAKLGKIDFTATNFTSSNSYMQATLAANGKYPVKVMRQNGADFEEVLVHTKVSGGSIVIIATEAFAGYVVTM